MHTFVHSFIFLYSLIILLFRTCIHSLIHNFLLCYIHHVVAVPQEGDLVSELRTDYRDGFLRCSFSHAARYTVDDRPVDLASSDLHLMVASGPGQERPDTAHNVWWTSEFDTVGKGAAYLHFKTFEF